MVAKKLGRAYVGIEIDESYCCLAEKRLAVADAECAIQGYRDGVFWERNSLATQRRVAAGPTQGVSGGRLLFDAERPR